jgi:tetratricopeptide (TPR) repeat protein
MKTAPPRRGTAAPPPRTTAPRLPARLDAWIAAHPGAVALALYGVAAALRLWYLLDFRHTLVARAPLLDEEFYRTEAWNLVRGAPPALDAPFMTPLYPLFLSVVFRLVGDGPVGPYAVQLGLGALVAPMTFVVARRVVGPALAVAAALAIASFAPLVFFEALFLVEGLVLLGLGAALTCAVLGPRRSLHAALCGVCLGIGVLGRGSNLLLAAPLGLWFLLHRTGGLGPALRRTALFGLGLVAALAPLLVHNAVRSGRPLLLTANAGLNAYIGNGPEATGIFVRLPGLDPIQDPVTLRYVQRQLGRPVTATETSDYWMQRTRAWVRQHPGRTLDLFAWKLLLFWNRLAIPQVEGFESAVHGTRLESAPFWRSFVCFPLGALGTVCSLALVLRARSRRDRPAAASPTSEAVRVAALLAACTLVYSASIALFFVTDRYRVAVLPWLVVLAVFALALVGRAARVAPRRLLVLLSVAGVCFWATAPQRLPIDRSRMQRDLHVHTALRFAKAGEFPAAIGEYDAALRLDPGDAELQDGLARLLGRAGQDERAASLLEGLVRRQPDHASGWYNLGNAYRRLRRYPAAVDAYQQALRLEPQRESAWNNLGQAYHALGDTARAAGAWQRALDVVPRYAQALNNLAALRGQQGDGVAAEAGFRAAVAADPRYVPALRNLAVLLEDTGRGAQAEGLWRRILALEPGNELAARRVGRSDPAAAAAPGGGATEREDE